MYVMKCGVIVLPSDCQYCTGDMGTSSQGMQRDPKRLLSQPREPQLIWQFVAMALAIGFGLHIKDNTSTCNSYVAT